VDRRTFCVLSAAAAAGIAAGRMGRWAPAAPAVPVTLYKIIFDTRFSASRAFGMAAAGSGRMTAAIGGDVTALWSDDLRWQWARGGGAIAGMTTMPSFFCLQQLAADHWMRGRILLSPLGGKMPAADPRLVSWVIA